MLHILLNWQLGTRFGWGLLALGLFGHWANDPEVRALMGFPIGQVDVEGLDPLRLRRILTAVSESNQHLQRLEQAGSRTPIDAVQIDALGNDFLAPVDRQSRMMIGRVVFETGADATARQRLARYDYLLSASTWNATLLKEATGREVRVIHEGIDESSFVPGPRSGLFDPRAFFVFSGGKVEFRKAQDLVILGFRRFAARHPDAVLVTAWHSPWPQLSRGYSGRLQAPLELDSGGALSIKKWVVDNGVNPSQIIDLGQLANSSIPSVLREMHVALQPARAEACTSLPVKEAMACGVPVIAALNTGMLDLLSEHNSLPLRRQMPVGAGADAATPGWGESDVDEIDVALEFVYQNRSAAEAIGARGRQWLLDNGRTWRQHAATLKDWIRSLAGTQSGC